jgi:hypothetical protein
MKQRIALVAASALTAGFLSVVSAPAANAGAADLTIAANGVGGSIGFVSAVVTTDSAQTVTITSDGGVQFATTAGTDLASSITVTGGTISSVSAVTDGAPNAARTSLVFGDVAVTVVVKPNAGVTSMVIKAFTALADVATGTFNDKITVTVVAATTIGVLSASKSLTNWVAYGTTISSDADSDLTNIDVAGANIIANGAAGQIAYSLNDGNGTDLPSTGVISAVSSNPLIAISFDGSFFNTEIAQAVSSSNYGNIYVAQAVANTPASGTITIKYNGTTYTTKSVTMQGDIASIVVSDLYSGKTGVSGAITTDGGAIDATTTVQTTNAGSFAVVAKDAAGNVLGGKTVAADTTRYNNVVSAITLANSGATIKFSATAGLTAGPGTGSLVGTFSCPTTTEGTGGTKQRLKITNAALVTIYSNEFEPSCGGSPDSYTASLDKAVYVPGDIATLTITAKTSTGKAPYSAATTGTATTAVGITQGSQMTAVTAIAVTDTFGNTGVKTYKFVVGTTEGSYNMIVDLPKWSVANGYSGAAQTAKYTVASGTATVSNAQVLQSIVALIASINKQIQALQALILKKK